LYVATGKTASEIIMERADANKHSMGLTYYTGKRGPTQADSKIGNNYLAEGGARVKNRVTVMLLDYFEDQVDQGRLVLMSAAEEKLDEYIKFNGWPLLRDAGKITRAAADRRAIEQQKFVRKSLKIACLIQTDPPLTIQPQLARQWVVIIANADYPRLVFSGQTHSR